ncbi:cell wall-active antibiotics response protein LiaF [Thalassobacillus hwangdonensis]|uniref:Cell wall-active antibiotics response protein LiaF n=1 Tax=Thalassobacillus hwangdonensis TaxID=546108 RepID=A0ABW3KZM3_9BACI
MKTSFWNVLIAILLIGTGVFLFLNNIDVIDVSFRISWPIIIAALLITFGLKLWLESIIKKGGSWIWGSLFTIYGTLLLLGEVDVLVFSFGDILKLWPLLFIYIGFGMFFKKKKKPKVRIDMDFNSDDDELADDSSDQKVTSKKKKHMAIGDHLYTAENWRVEPMDFWNAVGDYKFDFTKAFIPEEDTPISVRGWVGDVKVLVPENLEFRVEANVKAGDINILGQRADGLNRKVVYETTGYQTARRRLTMSVDLKAGDVRVDKV